MPTIEQYPGPSPSPTPIPTKNALAVMSDNVGSYNEALMTALESDLDEPATIRNIIENNANMAVLLKAYSNES